MNKQHITKHYSRRKYALAAIAFVLLLFTRVILFAEKRQDGDAQFVTYKADVLKQDVAFYWKDEIGHNFKSIESLRAWLQRNHKKLLFATNGGMYKPDKSPQGLYIEKQKVLMPLDTATGSGNFYLKPNGVFYITTGNVAGIITTDSFINNGDIKYATQSGPMLLIDGKIHPGFTQGSANVNIRNGVGILPDGRVVFAMSKDKINFYNFASYFKSLGCKNALYLDGFVSRAYLPEKNWAQTDGNFGVIIGVTEEK